MSAWAEMRRGASLSARAARSGLLTLAGFGGAQFIRLASNLILTRLLFPEAFGLMALVLVFITGLALFSDVGITPAILQSRRGDDPTFLDTAWSVQVVRGFALWGVACLGAWPMAWIYDEPILAQLIPVAAAALAITGFKPTRTETANRHLMLGRLTAIEMGSQLFGVGTAIVLVWLTGSVWALVAANVIGAAADLAIHALFLPGRSNRFRIERAALSELIHFGKWVFLSTVCGFIYLQADKLMIGRYVPTDTLGIYNIGANLATVTWMLGATLSRRVLIPIYRESPPFESRENFLHLRRMRAAVTLGLMGMASAMALFGLGLVDVLYDPRYQMAGAVVVMIACAHMPLLLVMTYDQAALAIGDSRSFFVWSCARAVLTVGCLYVGLERAGLAGALVGLVAAGALAYPVAVWLARRARAWDPLHDAGFGLLGAGVVAGVIALHGDRMAVLLEAAR